MIKFNFEEGEDGKLFARAYSHEDISQDTPQDAAIAPDFNDLSRPYVPLCVHGGSCEFLQVTADDIGGSTIYRHLCTVESETAPRFIWDIVDQDKACPADGIYWYTDGQVVQRRLAVRRKIRHTHRNQNYDRNTTAHKRL